MNREPKNILPNATIFPDNSFRACFEITFSNAQSKAAPNTNNSPIPNWIVSILSSNVFPARSKMEAKTIFLFSFSLSNKKANIVA